jgi:hypothetical protein
LAKCRDLPQNLVAPGGVELSTALPLKWMLAKPHAAVHNLHGYTEPPELPNVRVLIGDISKTTATEVNVLRLPVRAPPGTRTNIGRVIVRTCVDVLNHDVLGLVAVCGMGVATVFERAVRIALDGNASTARPLGRDFIIA